MSSTIHNSATKKQPLEASLPAAGHQAAKGPPPRRSSLAGPKSNNTTMPAASRAGLSAQHAGRATGHGMLGFPSYGAASKVQLQPGAAAGIAAAAAAAALRSHVAAQATITAFAAQAARNMQAGHAASLFRQRQQALTTGTQGSTARSATANHSLRGLGQPQVPKTHHNHREGRQQQPGVGAAPSIHSTSFRTCTYNSRPTNSTGHSNNCSVINRRPGDGGGGGHHAGAAYCIIPQPAYHHGHGHRQQHQQQPPPPPPPFFSQNNRNGSCSSGSSSSSTSGSCSRIGPIGGRPKAAATGRTKQPLRQQGQQQKRSSGLAAGLATATMMEPAATARPTKAKRRRHVGRGRSSSLTDGNDNGNAEELDHQHHRGQVDEDGGTAGGSDRKQGGSTMSAEIRLERSREQNRQSSKKARIRRKGEEESLKDEIESLQVFRLMVEEGPDMMSIHGLDHRAQFRYASSAFQRVAGINPRGVLGRGLTDLVVAEDHVVVQEALLKVIFTRASDSVVSYRMARPHGDPLDVETSIRTGDQCIICVSRAVSRQQRPLCLGPPDSKDKKKKKKKKTTDMKNTAEFSHGKGGAAAGGTGGSGGGDGGGGGGMGGRGAGSGDGGSSGGGGGGGSRRNRRRRSNDDDDDDGKKKGLATNNDGNKKCGNRDDDHDDDDNKDDNDSNDNIDDDDDSDSNNNNNSNGNSNGNSNDDEDDEEDDKGGDDIDVEESSSTSKRLTTTTVDGVSSPRPPSNGSPATGVAVPEASALEPASAAPEDIRV